MSRFFELQGHRGARGLFAENTLEGFLGALAVGVTSVELDVAMTADAVLVVTHDPVLNPDLTRDASGAWIAAPGPAVRALRLADLGTYNVGEARPGSATARAHPLQRAFAAARIPTLEALFAALAPSRIVVDVEIKTDPLHPELSPPAADMAEAVIALARRLGVLDRLAVRSFDWRGLFPLRDRWPDGPLGWLTAPETANPLWRGQFGRPGVSVPASVAMAAGGAAGATWAPDVAELTPDLVAEAHALGLRVVPWTVNDPADMARLIGWGVDGLCTDRPDLARIVMAEAGLEPPPPYPRT
jgi:glycerophosphoryl diester phosphodiesterase